MNNYRYIARDLSGEQRKGLLQAASSNDALSWLREQQFIPIAVDKVVAKTKKDRRKVYRKRIKSADLASVCWQLTTMVEGGIPITEALEIISSDIDHMNLRQILKKILAKILKGETFSESLAEFPGIFNDLSCSIILAGETSGNMAGALCRLAEYFDNRDKLAKKVKSAMAYPIFILVFIILMVVGIMTFVVPRFISIFDQIGGNLPAFTQLFIDFYHALRHNFIYIIGLVVLLILSIFFVNKTKKGHYTICKIVLTMTLFGKILSQAFTVMFCNTMSILLISGVPVLETFDILVKMAKNNVIKDAITTAREQLVSGSNISGSLAKSGFFPNMVVKMIQVGEESGALPKVLDRTSNYYERKGDATITTLLHLLEPIMIVVVGAIVLVIVLALYLPIFSMTDVKG